MTARLEHTNYTVSNIEATAAWMTDLFGWHIRWRGDSKALGQSIHVGTTDHYLALYQEPTSRPPNEVSYHTIGGLNHIAVVVDDIETMRHRVKDAGFVPGEH
jgi:catechol 2,3-dioxygenase-like lactoylglutathione lyase family enzyme